MMCHPRLGCPIVDEIAATASAPALANTTASASKQAALATPKGLAPPALCYIRPDKLPFFMANVYPNSISARKRAVIMAMEDSHNFHQGRVLDHFQE